MSFLPIEEVNRYLDEIRHLSAAADFTDLHVHATEVIRGKPSYTGEAADVLSDAGAPPYRPPEAAALRLSMPDAVHDISMETRNKLSESMFTRAFRHTGVRVIHDQLDLAGIRRALLLPVATGVAAIDEQMEILAAMKSTSDRLLIGYCVPSNEPAEHIRDHLAAARARWGIAAIKLHPNLSGIDLESRNGRDHVEAILDASHALNLPIIVHGGCSPILGNSEAACYSAIETLSRIDWSSTGAAVVIAHFGVYGCGEHQAKAADFSTVNALLDRHDNLYLDTSGLGPEAIADAMAQTDPTRTVFGSDALYLPVWQVLVSVCHALSGLTESQRAETMIRIASSNAARILGSNR